MTADGTIAIEREMRIAARPEIVFGLLTDATQMLRWQGVEAELEPRPGGVYRVVRGWRAEHTSRCPRVQHL